MAGPEGEPDIRASDADRDRIADILREALAEGRLDAEEHAERIDAVYRARTRGELRPLIRDLPASGGSAAPAAGDGGGPPRSVPATQNLVAVFGGAMRRGRFRVGYRTNALAVFGGVEIDLTEAVFEQQEITVNVWSLFGGVEIKVPENVSLRGTGTGIFGAFDVASYEAPDPQAPVIRIRGIALFSGVEAKAVRGKRLKNLRAG
ncbi:DUF1707 SHOCT-like domain-containing protein [Streptomyces palmae]|uniref:DUF1707 and DUF2154 domain-containing protein n=1 Tax=Streptomyces palmae TaxID=1701085 RepID=A0A4Z0GS18_9ACTN|nr:DUF1707 domain-containing protein [Streptomyces palmae]TGA99704.1 DUF1707 and DUF2154 domain-containing protein [Streptomyces palmae]